MSTVLCLGCGKNITERISDRRNLCTESSSPVLLFWKEIFLSKLENDGVEAETFVKDVIEKHRMCRRCFSAMDRLQKVIETQWCDEVQCFHIL